MGKGLVAGCHTGHFGNGRQSHGVTDALRGSIREVLRKQAAAQGLTSSTQKNARGSSLALSSQLNVRVAPVP